LSEFATPPVSTRHNIADFVAGQYRVWHGHHCETPDDEGFHGYTMACGGATLINPDEILALEFCDAESCESGPFGFRRT
jgi:hypothetical protein